MNIYVVQQVFDNPLYHGLSMIDNSGLLETWPTGWRKNYQTWVPKSLKSSWPTPAVGGHVRSFNDFPCINLSWPAFSQRAVDLLRDILEPNGELLPVKHPIGTYYFYNCFTMANCIDIGKSKATKIDGGFVTSTEQLTFIDASLEGLTIFKARTQLLEVFCTQAFVDRVEAAKLNGFAFVPIWPLPEGVTYFQEMYRVNKAATKLKPHEGAALDAKGNTVVVRLYCEKKRPTKGEQQAMNRVVDELEKALYDPSQNSPDAYFGDFEGCDQVEFEYRVFLTTPDCDRLVAHLMDKLRTLPWPGRYHVVKRRGEFVDVDAQEEYVRLS